MIGENIMLDLILLISCFICIGIGTVLTEKGKNKSAIIYMIICMMAMTIVVYNTVK
jgi:hypothetical protein